MIRNETREPISEKRHVMRWHVSVNMEHPHLCSILRLLRLRMRPHSDDHHESWRRLPYRNAPLHPIWTQTKTNPSPLPWSVTHKKQPTGSTDQIFVSSGKTIIRIDFSWKSLYWSKRYSRTQPHNTLGSTHSILRRPTTANAIGPKWIVSQSVNRSISFSLFSLLSFLHFAVSLVTCSDYSFLEWWLSSSKRRSPLINSIYHVIQSHCRRFVYCGTRVELQIELVSIAGKFVVVLIHISLSWLFVKETSAECGRTVFSGMTLASFDTLAEVRFPVTFP